MSTEPTGFWRRLVWRYDGKPDLSRPRPPFRQVGWGFVRLPGERASEHRAEDEARELLRLADEADKRTEDRER